MGARYDKKTRERAKLEKKALFFVEINRQYCEHLPDNERGYMSMYGPADDAKAAQVSRLLLRLSGVSEEAIDSAYPVAELRGMERGGEGQWISVTQELPPKNEYVQWATKNGETVEGYYEPWPNGMQFWRMTRYPGDPHRLSEVTHWMRIMPPSATLSVTEGVDGAWVDVNQELPPLSERIDRDKLSYSKDVLVGAGEDSITAYLAQYDNQDARWVSTTGGSINPTHWMPLPKPPQSGVDGREK